MVQQTSSQPFYLSTFHNVALLLRLLLIWLGLELLELHSVSILYVVYNIVCI